MQNNPKFHYDKFIPFSRHNKNENVVILMTKQLETLFNGVTMT